MKSIYAKLLIVLGLALFAANFGAQAQDAATSSGYSEDELRLMREAYIENLRQRNPAPIVYQRNRLSQAESQSQIARVERSFERLQLAAIYPDYVPFDVAPRHTAQHGLFTQQWMGGFPMQYGTEGSLLIYPNDPTNGWARRMGGFGIGLWDVYGCPTNVVSPYSRYFNPFFNTGVGF